MKKLSKKCNNIGTNVENNFYFVETSKWWLFNFKPWISGLTGVFEPFLQLLGLFTIIESSRRD